MKDKNAIVQSFNSKWRYRKDKHQYGMRDAWKIIYSTNAEGKYEGDLVDSDEFSDVIYSSKTMLSIFNDLVYRTAQKYNGDVLELRNIFISSEDYANPIEPSHIGGEKLAKSIVEWVNNG